jgi:hypothetical protein
MTTDQVRVRSLYAGLNRTTIALGLVLAAAWLFAAFSYYLSRKTGTDWFARSGSIMGLSGAAVTFRLGAQRRPRIGVQRNRARSQTAQVLSGPLVWRLSHRHRRYRHLGLRGPAAPTRLVRPRGAAVPYRLRCYPFCGSRCATGRAVVQPEGQEIVLVQKMMPTLTGTGGDQQYCLRDLPSHAPQVLPGVEKPRHGLPQAPGGVFIWATRNLHPPPLSVRYAIAEEESCQQRPPILARLDSAGPRPIPWRRRGTDRKGGRGCRGRAI